MRGVCIRRLIYDPREWEEEEAISRMEADELNRLPGAGELREIDRERISRMKADELDRLVAAREISDADRERVRFIVREAGSPQARTHKLRKGKNTFMYKNILVAIDGQELSNKALTQAIGLAKPSERR